MRWFEASLTSDFLGKFSPGSSMIAARSESALCRSGSNFLLPDERRRGKTYFERVMYANNAQRSPERGPKIIAWKSAFAQDPRAIETRINKQITPRQSKSPVPFV